jgi:hypothetical protein
MVRQRAMPVGHAAARWVSTSASGSGSAVWQPRSWLRSGGIRAVLIAAITCSLRLRHIAVVLALCGFMAAPITPAGQASASPCNGPDCVPNVSRNAAVGAPCVPHKLYDFGLDPSGRTLICVNSGGWAQSLPLVGVRDMGDPCNGVQGTAQSPDGIPMTCSGVVWVWGQDTPR